MRYVGYFPAFPHCTPVSPILAYPRIWFQWQIPAPSPSNLLLATEDLRGKEMYKRLLPPHTTFI